LRISSGWAKRSGADGAQGAPYCRNSSRKEQNTKGMSASRRAMLANSGHFLFFIKTKSASDRSSQEIVE
jgi:hypothetical protein